MDKKEHKNIVNAISKRLLLALNMVEYSAYRLAKEVDGISEQTFVSIRSGKNAPSTKVIALFLKKFPEINGHWLMTGEGMPKIKPAVSDEVKKLPYTHLLHDIPIDEIINYIENYETARGFNSSHVYNLFLEVHTQKKLIEKMNAIEARLNELSKDRKNNSR